MNGYSMSPANATSPRAQVQTGVPQKFVLDNFAFNKSDLTTKHKNALNDLAKLITDTHQTPQPVLQMMLVGHTDNVGSWTYNHSLGLKRAFAAATYLLYLLDKRYGKQLLFPVPVTLNSEGELSPVSNTAAQNRRVDIWLRAEAPRPMQPQPPGYQQPRPPRPQPPGYQPPRPQPPGYAQPPSGGYPPPSPTNPPRGGGGYSQGETVLDEILGYEA